MTKKNIIITFILAITLTLSAIIGVIIFNVVTNNSNPIDDMTNSIFSEEQASKIKSLKTKKEVIYVYDDGTEITQEEVNNNYNY